jgi:hypothetical protein
MRRTYRNASHIPVAALAAAAPTAFTIAQWYGTVCVNDPMKRERKCFPLPQFKGGQMRQNEN